jgi:hypothetical protein
LEELYLPYLSDWAFELANEFKTLKILSFAFCYVPSVDLEEVSNALKKAPNYVKIYFPEKLSCAMAEYHRELEYEEQQRLKEAGTRRERE